MMTRRQAIKTGVIATAVCAAGLPEALAQTNPAPMGTGGSFKLPPLPYPSDALEPYIDAGTMELHHGKHHASYVSNLNRALIGFPDLHAIPVVELLKDLAALPDKIRPAVRNHGGGHYNHSLFWPSLKKDAGPPQGPLARAMEQDFGSFDAFKAAWTKEALGQFGSGWVWLCLNGHKQLVVEPMANQDSPVSHGRLPLLGIDVWEHAYYLKYQNLRTDYVAAFFNVINWEYVGESYEKAMA